MGDRRCPTALHVGAVCVLLCSVLGAHGFSTAPRRVVPPRRGDTSPSSGSSGRYPWSQNRVRLLVRDAMVTDNDLSLAVEENRDNAAVRSILEELERDFLQRQQGPQSEATDDDRNMTRFQPLLGLYSVRRTVPFRAEASQENPVGGKWTRNRGGALGRGILSIHATYQHLLPPNSTGLQGDTVQDVGSPSSSRIIAEAINHVRLSVLGGWWTLHVLLRGNVTPVSPAQRRPTQRHRFYQSLSPWAVQVDFDPPRILLERSGARQRRPLALSLGPTSSVVLDTTYLSPTWRIGMGGTSGTRFLFRAIPRDDEGARDYQRLLRAPIIARRQVLGVVGLLALVGARIGTMPRWHWGVRGLGGVVSLLSLVTGGLVAVSSGGIERGGGFGGGRLRQALQEDDSVEERPATVVTEAGGGGGAVDADTSGEAPKTLGPKLDEEGLAKKYASIDKVEDRAYQILVDLGMVTEDE